MRPFHSQSPQTLGQLHPRPQLGKMSLTQFTIPLPRYVLPLALTFEYAPLLSRTIPSVRDHILALPLAEYKLDLKKNSLCGFATYPHPRTRITGDQTTHDGRRPDQGHDRSMTPLL
jgi:hypothetical protein